jgi:hypothetical protein
MSTSNWEERIRTAFSNAREKPVKTSVGSHLPEACPFCSGAFVIEDVQSTQDPSSEDALHVWNYLGTEMITACCELCSRRVKINLYYVEYPHCPGLSSVGFHWLPSNDAKPPPSE